MVGSQNDKFTRGPLPSLEQGGVGGGSGLIGGIKAHRLDADTPFRKPSPHPSLIKGGGASEAAARAVCPQALSRGPIARKHTVRRSFTLTEMLVVIAIMAVLAGLISVAVVKALTFTKDAAITTEISNLDAAMKAFKEKYGAYPPDYTDPSAVLSFVARAFPRNQDDFLFGFTADPMNPNKWQGGMKPMSPAQALVFWLRGQSGDPIHPIPTTLPNFHFFDFDPSRLIPNPNTIASPPSTLYQAKYGKAPYVYFQAATYSQFSDPNNLTDLPRFAPGGASNVARPYASNIESTPNNVVYMNQDSFQIISAGQDGKYGADVTVSGKLAAKYFPNGDNYTIPDENDNLTNFSTKTLENSKP